MMQKKQNHLSMQPLFLIIGFLFTWLILGFENLASLERTRFLGGKGVPKAEFLVILPFKEGGLTSAHKDSEHFVGDRNFLLRQYFSMIFFAKNIYFV